MSLWISNILREEMILHARGESKRNMSQVSSIRFALSSYYSFLTKMPGWTDSGEAEVMALIVPRKITINILTESYFKKIYSREPSRLRDCYYCKLSKQFVYGGDFYFRDSEENVHYRFFGLKKLVKKHKTLYRVDNNTFAVDYPSYSFYHYGPRDWPIPRIGERFFGHEFELKFKSYTHKMAFANFVKENHKPFICEKDGSLDNGEIDGPSLELITPPLSVNDGLLKLGEIFHFFKDNGGISTQTSGYAWHVTINAYYGEKHFDDIFKAFNANQTFWKALGGRETGYSQQTGKDYCQWEKDEKFALSKWGERWDAKPRDHYYAVYPRPKGGIELRFIQSMTDINKIKNIMECISLAVDWAKLENKEPFLEYVTQNSSRDLTLYLEFLKLL